MTKCPFCHFDNEDGALFCEQCKSDLAAMEPAAPVQVAHAVVAAAGIETIPLVSPVVEAYVAEIVVADGIVAEAVVAEAVPLDAFTTTEPIVPNIAHMPAAPEPPSAPSVPAVEALAPAPAPAAGGLPAGAEPRLLVLRGQKRNVEFPIYEGNNFIGRADEKPVDIDLEDQEPPDRVWSSRQHAVIAFENGQLTIEDLNSSNGTFVNRAKIYPGQRTPLNTNDVIQIGTVQMKVIV